MKTSFRSQPRIPKMIRVPSASSLPPKLREAVEQEARHFNVSLSFVMAVAIGQALGVDLPYHYAVERRVHRRAA